MNARLLALLVAIFLASLACALPPPFQLSPAPVATPVALATLPAGRPTLEATNTTLATLSTPTGTPSSTPSTAPTGTPTGTATVTSATAMPNPTFQAVFEALWKEVHDHYVNFRYNGLDWNTVHTQVGTRVDHVNSADEFYTLMRDMIAPSTTTSRASSHRTRRRRRIVLPRAHPYMWASV